MKSPLPIIKKSINKVRASALFKSFHDRDPVGKEVITVKQASPEVVLEVGELVGVMYKVNGIKEPYLHRFRGKPRLYVSYDGKQIYIIGGSYKFTERGFIG